MRHLRRLPALVLVIGIAFGSGFAPDLAWARAGDGASLGSRGSQSYIAPRSTPSAPYSASPLQRSVTPGQSSYGSPNYGTGYGYGSRSGFGSGLLGGLVGVGLGSLLFGHGYYGHGGFGVFGFFGLLLRLAILFFLIRWVVRLFVGGSGPAFAGLGSRMGFGGSAAGAGFAAGGMMPPPRGRIALTPADYMAFEQILLEIQAAWSAGDILRLQRLATPEMVGYFNEQLSTLASRGLRNQVNDVHLERGDLSEAWAEGSLEYATVSMRFSMTDATFDSAGHVVSGSTELRSMVTEFWTFVRANGGQWLVSAIQQTR